MTKVVGLYEKSKSFGFVRPDNQRFLKDIYIPAGKELHAMTGHKVVVELTSYGGEHMKPEGKIIEILGHVNDPGTDILSIVKDFDIPTEFPEKVLNQAVRVGKKYQRLIWQEEWICGTGRWSRSTGKMQKIWMMRFLL